MQNTPKYSEDILSSLRGRVAIVGNATPKHEFGAVIDRYDRVIRLNNFRIAGFEKFVGSKTTLRCTSAWTDIEHRNEHAEFSPFIGAGTESSNLETFNTANLKPVLCARTDVRPLVPEIPKPSTGFALAQLCARVGLPVDLFGFDGFKSPHYWDGEKTFATTHSKNEVDFLLQCPGILLFGETYPYEKLYDYCHEEHADYDQNVGLELVRRLKMDFRGLSMIEFGSGNGDLARHLEKSGNHVTAVEASQFAFAKIACTKKIHGTALALPLIEDSFDCFISVDVLEHLTENDCRIVIREAARLAKGIFVSVSTRPSGLLGPDGENLHLTVQPTAWWAREFEKYFTVRTSPGYGDGQLVIEGKRKGDYLLSLCDSAPMDDASLQKQNEFYNNLFTRSDGWSAAQPNEDEAARWGQIEPMVRELAQASPTPLRILDLGCGRGWLTNLLSAYGQIEGVEPVAMVVEHARTLSPDLQFTAGYADAILDRESFAPYDLVVSSEVIEHVTDKPVFVAALKRLLTPGGHLILTTPRGEALLEWTRLFGDPSQPVEDWMTEAQLSEVCLENGFGKSTLNRVWFDIAKREFQDATCLETCDNPIAIYQVWKFQSIDVAELVPSASREQILAEFHGSFRVAAESALAKLPDNPLLLTARGTALLGLGEAELSRRVAVEATALHPNFIPARELCARALRQLGREQEARIHETRAAAMREKSGGAGQQNEFVFLEYLSVADIVRGSKALVETRFVSIDEVSDSCLYLHPPAQLAFEIPSGSAGRLTTAIAIQPEAWDQPGAGGCEFSIFLDDAEVFSKRINPTAVPADRCWHEVSIEIPASGKNIHKITFGTRALGSPADFRWALWRRPVFTWETANK